MSNPIPKNSTFTTDITVTLVDGITTPKVVMPNENTGALTFSTVNNNIKTDYIVFDTYNQSLLLNQISSAEGFNVDNNFNVSGNANFNQGPVNVNGIIYVTSKINSNEYGNGAVIIEGGQYIGKDLFVSGNAYKPNSQFWSHPSDKRVKENIEEADFKHCIDSIEKLKIKKFNYTDEYKKYYKLNNNNNNNTIGVIADDVEQTHPHLVEYINNSLLKGFKNVNLGEQFYEMIACVQYLLKENKKLNEKLEQLLNRENKGI